MTPPNHNLSSAQFPADRYAEGLNRLSAGNARFSVGPRGSTMTRVNQEREVNEDVRSGRPFIMRHREGTERQVHALVQNETGAVVSPYPTGNRFDSVDDALQAASRDGDQVHWGQYINRRS